MKTPKSPETKNSTFNLIKRHSRKLTTVTAFAIFLITSSFAPRLCATAGVKQQAPASIKQVKKGSRPKNNRRIKNLSKKTAEFEREKDSISPYQQQIKNPGILHETQKLERKLRYITEDICTGGTIRISGNNYMIDPLDYSLYVDLLKTSSKYEKLSVKLNGSWEDWPVKSSLESILDTTSLSNSGYMNGDRCSIEKITNEIEEYAQLLTLDSVDSFPIDIPVYEKLIMLKNLKNLIAENPYFPADVEVEYYINKLANHPDHIDKEKRAQQRLDYIIKILQEINNSDEGDYQFSVVPEIDIELRKELEQHYKDLLSLMEYQEGEIDEKDFL